MAFVTRWQIQLVWEVSLETAVPHLAFVAVIQAIVELAVSHHMDHVRVDPLQAALQLFHGQLALHPVNHLPVSYPHWLRQLLLHHSEAQFP